MKRISIILLSAVTAAHAINEPTFGTRGRPTHDPLKPTQTQLDILAFNQSTLNPYIQKSTVPDKVQAAEYLSGAYAEKTSSQSYENLSPINKQFIYDLKQFADNHYKSNLLGAKGGLTQEGNQFYKNIATAISSPKNWNI